MRYSFRNVQIFKYICGTKRETFAISYRNWIINNISGVFYCAIMTNANKMTWIIYHKYKGKTLFLIHNKVFTMYKHLHDKINKCLSVLK